VMMLLMIRITTIAVMMKYTIQQVRRAVERLLSMITLTHAVLEALLVQTWLMDLEDHVVETVHTEGTTQVPKNAVKM